MREKAFIHATHSTYILYIHIFPLKINYNYQSVVHMHVYACMNEYMNEYLKFIYV